VLLLLIVLVEVALVLSGRFMPMLLQKIVRRFLCELHLLYHLHQFLQAFLRFYNTPQPPQFLFEKLSLFFVLIRRCRLFSRWFCFGE